MMELLKELCEASGAPGFEDRIRQIYRREMEPLVDRLLLSTDLSPNNFSLLRPLGPVRIPAP